MSEAYAWFAAGYFFYDMWSMYKVHCALTAQKIALKLKQVASNTLESNNGKLFYENNKGTANGGGRDVNGGDIISKENSNLENSIKQVFEYDGKADTSGKGFAKYILSNPVMMIHHVFIGSFGLAVIAVRNFLNLF